MAPDGLSMQELFLQFEIEVFRFWKKKIYVVLFNSSHFKAPEK